MIVRLATSARADLRAIGDYIARANPRRARTFTRELRLRCAALSDFPNRFPLVPGREDAGLRHFAHGDYLVFYQVGERVVTVLHILHGAQDYSALLYTN